MWIILAIYGSVLGAWLVLSLISLMFALAIRKNIFLIQVQFARSIFGMIMNSTVTIAFLVLSIFFFTESNIGMGILFALLTVSGIAWRIIGGILTLPFSSISMVFGSLVASVLEEDKFLDQVEGRTHEEYTCSEEDHVIRGDSKVCVCGEVNDKGEEL